MSMFRKSQFENGLVQFVAHLKPVSTQNNGELRKNFKAELQKITSKSEFIVTGTCSVSINYYCQHTRRRKHPGTYDIDNIIKPIIDGLVGNSGLLIDDVIVNHVSVNWIDTQHDDYFDVEIEYSIPSCYEYKKDLIFLKSKTGWCYPTTHELVNNEDSLNILKSYLEIWNRIESEDDYYENLHSLPPQNFIYYVKVRDKGYKFIDV